MSAASKPTIPIAGLVLIAAVVDIVGFSSADRDTSPNWRALHQYESSNFRTLIMRDGGPTGELYQMHLALAELAPGSHVIVPSHGELSHPNLRAQLYGMGQAARVSVADIDAVARIIPQPESQVGLRDAPFNPSPFVVARGTGGDQGVPWAIALDSPDTRPTDLRDPDQFLTSLLGTGRSGQARGPGRELVLLVWLPEQGGGSVARRLLVETSVLPAGLTAGLA